MFKRSSDQINVDFLNRLAKGMCKVGSVTEVKILKKSRFDGSPVPAKFSDLKKVSFFVASVGHDYSNIVQNRVDKFGSGSDYNVEQSTVSVPFNQSLNGVMRSGIKDDNQKYIRLFFNTSPNAYNETKYVNGSGEVIVPSQYEIDAFFPKKTDVQKQIEHGLDKGTFITLREFKCENIIYFQSGQNVWNNLNDSFLKLFKLTNA